MAFYLAKGYYPNKGKYKRTPEIKAKNSENCYIADFKRTEETKKKISKAKKLYWSKMTNEQRKERLKNFIPKKGRKAWNKGKRSKDYYEAELARNTVEYSEFRKKCFERDLYTCCISGQKGGELVVHHICSFSDYPELRFVSDNGITMTKLPTINNANI